MPDSADTVVDQPPLPGVAGVRLVHRYIDTGRVTLHVAEAGVGDPVLLIHGWPQHWYAWRHVLPELATRHRVLCVDLRGAGWSEAPKSGYTTRDGVADLVALIHSLGLDCPIVVGHDWGGWLAIHLAIAQPACVRAVVAAGTAGPWLRVGPMLRHAWWYATTVPFETPLLGRWSARYLPFLVRAVLRRSAGPDRDQAVPRAVLDCYTSVLRGGARARASESVQRHRGYGEVVPTLAGRYRRLRLTVPTVLLVGDRDPGLSAAACQTAKPHANDLEVRALPGCGHLIPEERPEAVLRAVADLTGPDRARYGTAG